MTKAVARGAWIAVASLAAVLLISATSLAASPGPPFPPRSGDARVVDAAGAFSADARANGEGLISTIQSFTGGEVLVYSQVKAGSSRTRAAADAVALLAQWQVGGSGQNGLVLLFDFDAAKKTGEVALAIGVGYEAWLPNGEDRGVVDDSMRSLLDAGQFDEALTAGLSRMYLDAAVISGGGTVSYGSGSTNPGVMPGPGAPTTPAATGPAVPAASGLVVPAASGSAVPEETPRPTARPAPIPAGPPYPSPQTGRRIYDTAGVLRPDTIARAQQVVDGIEERTGAQVVVYTQLKPGVDPSDAEADAAALIDQWGIGRRGFDDGMVILFDLDQSLRHGQVQLYAAPGFRVAFLSNAERQAIYENDMLPELRRANLDQALLVALTRIDEAATPAHANALQTGRQVNAVIGLVGAPVAFLLLVGWVAMAWFRFGRDPHVIDDPSIYVAGPPADLTPAAAAFVLDGGSSRRALTATLLDFASRGEIVFRQDNMGMYGNVGLQVGGDPPDAAAAAIANSRPLGKAEAAALDDLRRLARHEEGGYLDPRALREFGLKVGRFEDTIERQVVSRGWFREAPRISRNRWLGRAVLEIVAGVLVFIPAAVLPSDGLTLVSLALIAAGLVTLVAAFSMPARTMAGAMIHAMLAAYRRTLAKTLETARSMNQAVADAQVCRGCGRPTRRWSGRRPSGSSRSSTRCSGGAWRT